MKTHNENTNRGSNITGTEAATRHLMQNNGTAKVTDAAGFWEGLEKHIPTHTECIEIRKKFYAWCEKRGIKSFESNESPIKYRNHDETAHSICDIMELDFVDDYGFEDDYLAA
jgi:hypothetical protein|tara:strand:+ start:1303 stop:1641 length:339 start_codon:yes stop_codon:yes gene_type:complete